MKTLKELADFYEDTGVWESSSAYYLLSIGMYQEFYIPNQTVENAKKILANYRKFKKMLEETNEYPDHIFLLQQDRLWFFAEKWLGDEMRKKRNSFKLLKIFNIDLQNLICFYMGF